MKTSGRTTLVYILLISLLVLLMCSITGCVTSPQQVEPNDKPRMGSAPPAPEEGIWTGTWDSEQWGEMKLTQKGNTITGTYTWDEGKIEGTVSGTTLRGTWSESPSYSPPDDAGDFEFTLSADGNSFSGHWRYGSEDEWDGDWTAEKVSK
jgi:hypothetical protein